MKAAIQEIFTTLKREYSSARLRAVDTLVYLTYRCSSQCRTCNVWKRSKGSGPKDELTIKDWLKIFKDLKGYGIETVEIFGGDALLRKDLVYDVIEFCSKNRMKTYFPTNSLLLDKDTAANLVNAGLDTIYFSLDDVGPETDNIRGKDGAFAKVRDAMENVSRERKNGKPHMIVCTTISNMNCGRLPQIARFARDFPIDAIYPRIVQEFTDENIRNSEVDGIFPEPYFVSSDGVSHLLNKDDMGTVRRTIRELKSAENENRIYINSDIIDMADDEVFTENRRPTPRCLAASTLAVIDPLGNVTPCPMYNNYHLGDLMQNRMEDIWGNELHCNFIKYQREKAIKICDNCGLNEYYPTMRETLSRYGRKLTKKAGLS